MKAHLVSLFWGAILFLPGCKEIYSPDIDNTKKVLVVDALITDEQKVFTIRISTALPFDSTGYIPETGAIVYITDNHSNTFYLKDAGSGNYITDPFTFTAKTGYKYTLHIETKEHKIYESTEQELLPKGELSEVKNFAMIKPLYLSVNGVLRKTMNKGAEIISTIVADPNEKPYYRFSNSIIIEYMLYSQLNMKVPNFCWKRYYPDEYFNLSSNLSNSKANTEHDLGFFPMDTLFYSIQKERIDLDTRPPSYYYLYKSIYLYVVTIRQYHLTSEISEYYSKLNKQLEARQHILDPIPFQVSGNMKCISNKDELAFGVFEVSSIKSYSYKVDPVIKSETYKMVFVPLDIDTVPETGIQDTIPPSTWIPMYE